MKISVGYKADKSLSMEEWIKSLKTFVVQTFGVCVSMETKFLTERVKNLI